MFDITATQLAFGLFFICLPIVMWRFFKVGFIMGAETMVQQLHESSFLTSKGVKELGLLLPADKEE